MHILQISASYINFIHQSRVVEDGRPFFIAGAIRSLVIIIILLLLSARFLSANVLRDYQRDQHETFQDDSLAFVDVRNEGHFFEKCMHARARAFEFLHIKMCKTNFFILCSNLFKFVW